MNKNFLKLYFIPVSFLECIVVGARCDSQDIVKLCLLHHPVGFKAAVLARMAGERV